MAIILNPRRRRRSTAKRKSSGSPNTAKKSLRAAYRKAHGDNWWKSKRVKDLYKQGIKPTATKKAGKRISRKRSKKLKWVKRGDRYTMHLGGDWAAVVEKEGKRYFSGVETGRKFYTDKKWHMSLSTAKKAAYGLTLDYADHLESDMLQTIREMRKRIKPRRRAAAKSTSRRRTTSRRKKKSRR